MNSPQRTACLAKFNAKGPFFFTYRRFSNDGNWTPYMRHLSNVHKHDSKHIEQLIKDQTVKPGGLKQTNRWTVPNILSL